MNVIEFKSRRSDIVFCLVDTTHTVTDGWSKEVVKNLADYTISSLYGKGYTVLQGLDEDLLLKAAAVNYKWAVVFTTGTEFIAGDTFFNSIEKLIQNDFLVCGHILDRKDAYYELHSQCYLINLKQYSELRYPSIGQQELGSSHISNRPWRSLDNYHDDYTPLWVSGGDDTQHYKHKCHGWNLLSIAFDLDLNVLVWDNEARKGKRHNYPESNIDFLKQSQWLYFRERYCATEFVHTDNTEHGNGLLGHYTQLVVPASGTLFFDQLDPNALNTVIVYDYNIAALNHWQDKMPKLDNVEYKFVQWDLLGEEFDLTVIDPNKQTLINLSNIFAYEGTAAFSPLKYRLYKENKLLSKLKQYIPEAHVNFSLRAASGYLPLDLAGKAKHLDLVDLRQLTKPTWHINQEWHQTL